MCQYAWWRMKNAKFSAVILIIEKENIAIGAVLCLIIAQNVIPISAIYVMLDMEWIQTTTATSAAKLNLVMGKALAKPYQVSRIV